MSTAPVPERPERAPSPVPGGLPRVFLREPGWRVVLKVGSERAFCFSQAPGEDYYHRLNDGEIYLTRGDERLCLPCAERRGLLDYEPRRLRERMPTIDRIGPGDEDDAYDVKDQYGAEP